MNTYENIIKILNEVSNLDGAKIDRDADFAEILDSLVFIKLLIEVDKNLGITIDDEDINFETFHSINAIVEYVDNKLNS